MAFAVPPAGGTCLGGHRHEGYGGLRLTDSCRPLLRGEVTLQLRRDLKPQAVAKSSGGGSPASQLVRAEERELWEALRALRRKLAEEHSVPPYVIFPDSTLLEMLRSQPTSLSDMAQVSGVGARKLERYGEAFLEVLNGGTGIRRRRWCSTFATSWSAWPVPA